MFWISLFFLYLPLNCDARIKLNITVASNKEDAIVTFSGSDYKLATDHEVELFNISKANLNHGMRVELGRAPNGIFLTDPTRYGNLFHKFKWPEVRRQLFIEKVEIDEIITKDVVLKIHEHFNNSTEDIKTSRSLFTNVENHAYSSWSETGMPEEDIFYDVVVNFDRFSFQYENKWKDQNLKATSVEFGISDEKNMVLKPGQAVDKKLTALETIFVVEVFYKAQLTGNFLADYENLYGKYHFYAPTVDNIMRAGNIPNEIRTGEKIHLRCYTNPRLEIVDKDTGLVIKTRERRKLVWKLPKKFW